MDSHDPFWQTIADRYAPERLLGRGGMAEVWLVTDLRHRRSVALKLLGEHLASGDGPDRFRREIELLARLQHPNILPLLDSGHGAGRLWYVTPYIAGESLRERLTREGKLSVEDALRLGEELLDALDYAHRQGIVHRDIKPENVLLSQGHALLADFGIAFDAQGPRMTATGVSMGSPAYMCPEQVSGDAVDARSDMYALACVLFECLAGQPPYSSPEPRVVMSQHLLDPVPSLRARRPSVPEAAAVAIERALAKDPADRWSDARGFARGLQQLPLATARTTRPWARLVAGFGAVLAVALSAVLFAARFRAPAVGPAVTLRQITFAGDVCNATISADGRHVAYWSRRQFWMYDLADDRPWPVSDSLPDRICHEESLGWAESGDALVIRVGESTWVAARDGGRAVAVGDSTEFAARVRTHDFWSERPLIPGETTTVGSRVTIQVPGQEPRTAEFSGMIIRRPRMMTAQVARDGRVAWFPVRAGHREFTVLTDLQTGTQREIAGTPHALSWSPDGRALYLLPDSGTGVLRQSLDRTRLRPRGRRTVILPGVTRATAAALSDVARGVDRAVFVAEQNVARVVYAAVEPGRVARSPEWTEVAVGTLAPGSVSIAGGGDSLLFVATVEGVAGLYAMRIPGGAPARIMSLPDLAGIETMALAWDGSIATISTRAGLPSDSSPDAFLSRLALVDLRERRLRVPAGWPNLVTTATSCAEGGWHPNGRQLLRTYSRPPEFDRTGIIVLDAVTERADTLQLGAGWVSCPRFAPDGRTIAVTQWDMSSQRLSLVLLSQPSGGARRVALDRWLEIVGWLSPTEMLAVTSRSDRDSVLAIGLNGRQRLVMVVPERCGRGRFHAAHRTFTCVRTERQTDIWFAQGFDPEARTSDAVVPPAP